jgi:hypothetical protein
VKLLPSVLVAEQLSPTSVAAEALDAASRETALTTATIVNPIRFLIFAPSSAAHTGFWTIPAMY